MALIIDPDDLNQGVEVAYNTTTKRIQLLLAGNLSNDGVTLKALYSFTKEEWNTDANLIKFEFPFAPITDESFELIDGWDFEDNTSRYLIRTGGWSVLDLTGNVTQKWAGIVGLGSIEANDQLYFNQGQGAVDFQLQGQVNQSVQILDDPNGDGNFADGFDRRSSFTMFVREQAQEFGQANISDIGVTQMDSIVYRFPISTSLDSNITTADILIDGNSDGVPDIAPYNAMSITYHPTDQVRNIGGTNYNFRVIIDGANATKQQIYEFVQFQLRQNLDIDAGAGAVTGKIADELLEFVGSILKTKQQSNGDGVYIDNFNASDTNDLIFVDNTNTERQFPFVATLQLQFSTTLQGDPNAIYRVFYTDIAGQDYGDGDAILVDDEAGADMSGSVGGNATITHSFDYDGNNQGGRTPATDANVTVVAIGTTGAQYVRSTGIITRSTSNVVALVSAQERNYSNP